MKISRLAAAAVTCFTSAIAVAVAADPVPPPLRLGDAATPRAYELRLAIDPRQDRFAGEVRIALHVNRATPLLWLNAEQLDIDEAVFVAGERRIKAQVVPASQDFVGLRVEGGLAPGDYTAEIRYRAPIEPLDTRGLFRQREAGEWYAITQFEAISARRAFPCFDEPQWKTPYRLTIDAPAADGAFSNAPEESVGDAPGHPGWKRHVFQATKPLTTYLVAFAVGPFDVVEGAPAAAPATKLRYLAPKGRGADARYARLVTPQLLGELEKYFGIPYPFEKLDTVPIPATVGFGAMENVGMITYSSELMLARPSRESLAFQRGYASVAAHEMAHQWFGDLVTLTWWNDTWLNEGFATWMSRKALRAWKPEWESGWRSGEGHRRAIASDRLMSARRIANPVEAKNDIFNAFDGITYSKGAQVLSMFEAWIGTDAFRGGVRQYLRDHAYGNATSADFFRALGAASGRADVAVAAFRSFIEQPGLPLLESKLRCEGSKAAIEVSPHRLIPKGTSGPEMKWMIPACFTYGIGDASYKQCGEVSGPTSIALTAAGACPDWVAGNAEGAGHWVARWDAAAQAKLVEHAARIPEREAVVLGANVDMMMGSGLMTTHDALALADRLLQHPSIGVRHAAFHVVETAQQADLSADDQALYRGIIQRRLLPLAADIGWNPKAGETLDVQDLRTVLLPFAAMQPGGERFRADARALGEKWLQKPESVDGSVAASSLRSAARYADAGLYERLEAALATTTDRRDRVDLLGALSAVEAPGLRARALGLMLARRDGTDVMSGRDILTFLEKALEDVHNRSEAFAYVRAHWDAIDAKLPHEVEGRLMREMTELCTAADRDAFKAFFGPRAAAIQGGPRSYAQALEAMDICVASLKH